ncbi:IclR family transcriptional regulator [Enterovirga sp.]|jgi:IclR family acetate operon transcriptional repressor|uniref:IclR family transcriptional regulator n=1 Tax=Enterovirga sp. TaxID=2026350 RepID=UPI002627B1A2|nr:IclR family transcriptional regulator [Enterovirga sp.]MDB5591256.1 hypothetical protein [Enterovirga sp.]
MPKPTRVAAAEPAAEEPAAPDGAGALSGTLRRGLAILDLLAGAGQPLTLADISAQTSLDLSTTLRILRTLEDARFVSRAPDGKRYLPSPKILRPLPLLHPMEQFRRESGPLLGELAAKFAKTVVLVVFIGVERVVVDIVQPAGSLSPYYAGWLQGPLHASGPGKALLLTMSPEQRRAALGEEPFRAYTPSTITRWSDLDRDLARADERGIIQVANEFYDGLSAVAANFSGWSTRAAGCIVLTGHTADFTPDFVERSGQELRRIARLMPLQAASLRALDQFCGF